MIADEHRRVLARRMGSLRTPPEVENLQAQVALLAERAGVDPVSLERDAVHRANEERAKRAPERPTPSRRQGA